MSKRLISVLLILAMLMGVLPVFAQAEAPTTFVDNGTLTAKGTNGFGALLAKDISQEQDKQTAQQAEGYTLTDLQITGNTATVTYDSLEEATVVVALYTEDGMQLLTSGTATVSPDETTATVTIDGEMPDYFMASAYLVDNYDMSPLCSAYDTPMYTKEMQDLLASTADDYDPDRVLQMEESPETNFAVYAETTKVIEQVDGVNTVTSVDDENNTYTIKNADKNITSLKVGDIFAYPYKENEILIIKVASIRVNGTTVTLTGDDMEIEEAFAYVKVESESSTTDITVDDSTADEGITYVGLSESGNTPRSVEGGVTTKIGHEFKIEKETEVESAGAQLKAQIKGSLKLQIETKFEYYISTSRQYLKFTATPKVTAGLYLEGIISLRLPMGSFMVMPLPCLLLGFEPKVELRFTGKTDITLTFSTTIGLQFESGKGFQNLTTAPKVDFTLDVEGTLFFGVDFHPKAGLFGTAAELELTMLAGIELTSKITGTNYAATTEKEEERHLCKECLEIELAFKAELSGKLSFLDLKWLTFEVDIGKFTFPIGDAYYSLDTKTFAFTTCPNKAYRTTVKVFDTDDTKVKNAVISNSKGEKLGTTNSKGVVIVYLPEGTQQLTATVNSKSYTKTISVSGAGSVKIITNDLLNSNSNILTDLADGISGNPNFIDEGSLAASGTCGDHLTWHLYDSGTLYIRGYGEMENFAVAPWEQYRYQIKKVVMEDGVTNIWKDAFSGCSSLTEVVIPNSVRSIGDYAFSDCFWLSEITIPNSVTSIGKRAFYYCYMLTEITIPDSVISIGPEAFWYCPNLTDVTLSDHIASIGDRAFADCSKLNYNTYGNGKYLGNQNNPYLALVDITSTKITDITIHPQTKIVGERVLYNRTNLQYNTYGGGKYLGSESNPYMILTGVTDQSIASIAIHPQTKIISSSALSFCNNLTSVTIPNGVISIGHNAFYDCYNLSQITIPNSMTAIGDYAFSVCNIKNITIPNSVRSIGAYAFEYCGNLTDVTIPSSVKNIGERAFYECRSLSHITLPDSITAIRSNTFGFCNTLNSIALPASVIAIENYAFYSCTSLEHIYYAGSQAQWNNIQIESVGNEYLLNHSGIHYNSSFAKTVSHSRNGGTLSGQMNSQINRANAVFGGTYGTEVTDTYTVKTAEFTGLIAEKEYVLLALVSTDTPAPLAEENLLFIEQAVAEADGTLSFRYVQKQPAALSYVMVCGASSKDLKDAQITFPEMTADSEVQAVQPEVVYDGKTLVEGKDYVITGAADFTKPGQYTCYIRGIYSYTGLVPCVYEVEGDSVSVSGTVTTGSAGETLLEIYSSKTLIASTSATGKTGSYIFDDIPTGSYTLRVSKPNHITREYEITVAGEALTQDVKIHLKGDVNGDGKINVGDTSKIYSHVKHSSLKDYQLLCADVSGDGRINVGDVSKVYSHIKHGTTL